MFRCNKTNSATRDNFFWLVIGWSIVLCLLFGWVLWSNANTPSFVYSRLGALYDDGNYIASVAKNISMGRGVSYWNGAFYRFLDPEISTGPLVLFPLAAALSAGVNDGLAFYAVPIAVNLSLLFALFIYSRSIMPLRVFFAWSFAVWIFSFSFQRWQWYLPLGEVPASLLLLLAVTSLHGVWDGVIPKSVLLKRFGWCGALWALAVLSKMLVLMTAPCFLCALIGIKSWRAALLAALSGAGAVFFVICLVIKVVSPNIEFFVFLKSLYGYVTYNFNFGIGDWFSWRSNSDQSMFVNIWSYAVESFSRIPSIGDTKGYVKSGVVLSLFFSCFSMGIFFNQSKRSLFYIVMGVICVFVVWYLFSGQHDSRYFFVVGYVGLFFSSLFLVLLDVDGNRQAVVLVVGALFFSLLGRGIFYKSETTFVYRTSADDMADFIDRNSIGNLLSSETVFHGYPSIYYYRDNFLYYSSVGYLLKTANLIAPKKCQANEGDAKYQFPGPFSDYSYRCVVSEVGNPASSSVRFQWRDNRDGYFLKRVMKWEVGIYKPDCNAVLYANERYILMQCSKKEMENIILRESKGKLVVSF